MGLQLLPTRLRVPPGLRAGVVIGVALALLGIGVGTATGVGQMFQQVLVVNPSSSPVPVAGTVNVGNLPSTQPVSGTVTIGNSTSSPVPVVDVNGSATEPVSFTFSLTLPNGVIASADTCYTVPAGKRLVIQQVSVNGELPSPQVLERVFVGASGDPLYVVMHDEGPFNAGFYEVSTGSQFGVAYADAGAAVYCRANRSGSTSNTVVDFSVAGYLVP